MPELSVSRRRALAAVALLLLALIVAVRQLGGSDAPTAAARLEIGHTGASRAPAARRPQVVVHVVGAVRRPGLYTLAEGSRVADAVARAGGATGRADVAAVTHAAPLADGLQVVVPTRGAAGAHGSGAAAAGASAPVHLNSASVEQLDALPGIGPATAQKIVEHREKHGAFRTVEDLDAVPGIGPARLEQLRELVAP